MKNVGEKFQPLEVIYSTLFKHSFPENKTLEKSGTDYILLSPGKAGHQ